MVFCKAPIPGQVKTRLAQTIGDNTAAEIHQQLVVHCLETVTSLNLSPIELWCSPSTNHPFFQYCKNQFGVELKQQPDGDLGRRMSQAFKSALADSQFAVVIGTDCPVIDSSYLHDAFTKLDNKTNLLIGPAEDGGYVLLGMREYQSGIFEAIPWGSSRVFSETCEKVKGEIALLPTLWDIDYGRDLIRLRQESDQLCLGEGLIQCLNDMEL